MKHSETFTAIAAALARAAGDFAPIKRDRQVTVHTKPKGDRPAGQYTFNYAPLDSILNAVRPALCKHELVLVQSVVQEEIHQGEAIVREELLETRLIHSSGEWFSNTCPVLVADGENSAQAYGSAITYARRYAITQLLCVVADEDEDGNAASGNVIQRSSSGGSRSSGVGGPPISAKQVGLIRAKLAAIKGDEVGLCIFMQVEALEALPKGRMDDALAAIEAKEPAILQGFASASGSAPTGDAAGPQSPAQIAKRKAAHDKALVDNKESHDFIVKTLDAIRELRQEKLDAEAQGQEGLVLDLDESINRQTLDVALEWKSLPQKAQEDLWLATKHGGAFTTADREDIRAAISYANSTNQEA